MAGKQSRIVWSLGLMVLAVSGRCEGDELLDWKGACDRLVSQVVQPAGITNVRVLEVLRNTPRHQFVPNDQRAYAYYDMALPIGGGQTISPPYIVAFMTQIVDPKPTDKVLEIGTGSGYQAAILSPLVAEVYTIEIVESLGQRARKTLRKLKYKNVHTRIGDGYLGWPSKAPFDKIIVTCSPEKIPPALTRQLREGGRMVIPVGQQYQQTLFLMKSEGGKLVSEALEPTFFVPMTGEAQRLREQAYDASRPRLTHGGFELEESSDSPLKGWYYLRQGEVITDSAAPEGDRFLQFSNTTPGRGAQVLQAFGVDGRTVRKLDVSLWIKADALRLGRSDRETAHLEVSFFDHRRAPIGRKVIGPWQGTLPWEKKHLTVIVPSKARLAVLGVGMFGSVGQLSIDDVKVQKGRSAP